MNQHKGEHKNYVLNSMSLNSAVNVACNINVLFKFSVQRCKARQVYLFSTFQTQGNSKRFTGAYKLHKKLHLKTSKKTLRNKH